MAKMGRPQINIDKSQFENLLEMNATLREIAGWFKCSEDTIENFSKREYGMTFSECFEKYSQKGKISLRRAMFKSAMGGNVPMQIFLAKNFLGMTDKSVVGVETEEESKKIAKEFLDWAKEVKDEKD